MPVKKNGSCVRFMDLSLFIYKFFCIQSVHLTVFFFLHASGRFVLGPWPSARSSTQQF